MAERYDRALNPNANTNVYVVNLPVSMTQRKFRALFQPFGAIIGVRLVPRRKGLCPVGFVQYTQPEMAAAAIEQMDGHWLEGCTLSVTLAKRDKDKGIANKPCANLYVANLPLRYDEKNLEALFVGYGPIHSLRILRFPDTGMSKGTALVRFEALEDAVAAKESLHCRSIQKQALPLEVKYAESKEDRLLRREESARATGSRSDPSASDAPKAADDAEDADDADLGVLLAYVAEVVDRCSAEWAETVLHQDPSDVDDPALPRRSLRELTAVLRSATHADPPEGESDPGSLAGSSSSTGSVTGGEKDVAKTSDFKLNPKATPFVPRVGGDRKTVESIIVENLASRIAKMNNAELERLSAQLLALGPA